MSWDAKRLGFYCSRCDAPISMVTRQERFLGKYGEGRKNSDPYVSVAYHAFFEEDKKKFAYAGAYHYCWDCEKELSKILEEFNSKNPTHGAAGKGDSAGNDDGKVLLLDSNPSTPERADAPTGVHADRVPK